MAETSTHTPNEVVTESALEKKRVAKPDCLRMRLQAFKIGRGSNFFYELHDSKNEKTYKLEPWQFIALDELSSASDFDELIEAVHNRTGLRIDRSLIEQTFVAIATRKLFGREVGENTLIGSLPETGADAVLQAISPVEETEAPNKKPDSAANVTAASSPATPVPVAPAKGSTSSGAEGGASGESKTGGDLLGVEAATKRLTFKLFDPRRLLKLTQPTLAHLGWLIYALPILLACSLGILVSHFGVIQSDVERLLGNIGIVEHLLFGMVTANLLVTATTAVVAHGFRATVSSINFVLIMGFLPRFAVQVGHTDQLQRRERLLLHAAPLLVRVMLFSLGVLLWYGTRDDNGPVAVFALALAAISAVSFLFTLNPFARSSGYNLLATYLDEPHLRGKAVKASYNVLAGKKYSHSNRESLVAYGLACMTFTVTMLLGIVGIVAAWLGTTLGGSGFALAAGLSAFLGWRTYRKADLIRRSLERSDSIERWRKRTLTEEDKDAESVAKSWGATALRRAGLLALVVALFLPYTYEPSGQFEIEPIRRSQLSTDISGIIAKVYYDGGELLDAGTVIAELAHDDLQAQVEIFNAKMAEQRSIADELRARPRPEELVAAKEAVRVARIRVEFSKGEFEREARLNSLSASSFDDVEQARRQYEVEVARVAEAVAALEIVKAGAPDDQILAEEARYDRWREERDSYQAQIDRSLIRMPFKGRLAALQLKQKEGDFLERGEIFADAENTAQMIATVEIPEQDIADVEIGAVVRLRPWEVRGETRVSSVTEVDPRVTERSFGRVVKVLVILDNEDGSLRAGMTGKAKIEAATEPVWSVFTQSVARFFNVEVWSWIP